MGISVVKIMQHEFAPIVEQVVESQRIFSIFHTIFTQKNKMINTNEDDGAISLFIYNT